MFVLCDIHRRESQHSIMGSDGQSKGENLLGAFLFYSYILAALFLSCYIIRDLIVLYTSRRPHPRRPQTPEDDAPDDVIVSVMAALSVLSFAMLSYHMLSFLIQSYQSWTKPSQSFMLPKGRHDPVWRDLSFGSIWTWSTSSTLFQDFAQDIWTKPECAWWTQLALLYSLGWNMYMSIEGKCTIISSRWCMTANPNARNQTSSTAPLGIFLAGSNLARVLYSESVLSCHASPAKSEAQ
jgi:hypothetical protein